MCHLSILICTRNRSNKIIGCLESVKDSIRAVPYIFCEVIVIDNGSTDETSTKVKQWISQNDITIKLFYELSPGLAHARNRAIFEAGGELLVFTDDDCHMHLEYVKDVIKHFKGNENVLRGGSVRLGDLEDFPITVKTEKQSVRYSREANSAKSKNLSHLILGCNMVISRNALAMVGLFDPIFGAGSIIPSGEDMDFVYRAYIAGIAIEYVPDMIVIHYHGRRTIEQSRKLFINYMLGTGALYAKYLFKFPDFCRPAIWDIKSALREIFVGKNEFLRKIGFSHREIVLFCTIGFFRYWATLISRKLKIRVFR